MARFLMVVAIMLGLQVQAHAMVEENTTVTLGPDGCWRHQGQDYAFELDGLRAGQHVYVHWQDTNGVQAGIAAPLLMPLPDNGQPDRAQALPAGDFAERNPATGQILRVWQKYGPLPQAGNYQLIELYREGLPAAINVDICVGR